MSIKPLIVLLAVVVTFTAFVFAQNIYTTLIIEGKNGMNAFLLRSGDSIELSFIHSVELSRWVEIYEVRPNGLILKKAMTKSFGWGLPYSGNFSFEDDWMVFRMNRTFKKLEISISDLNDYTLKIEGKIIKLDSFGDFITLKPEGGLMPWIYQKLRKSFFMKENFLDGKQS